MLLQSKRRVEDNTEIIERSKGGSTDNGKPNHSQEESEAQRNSGSPTNFEVKRDQLAIQNEMDKRNQENHDPSNVKTETMTPLQRCITAKRKNRDKDKNEFVVEIFMKDQQPEKNVIDSEDKKQMARTQQFEENKRFEPG